MLPARIKLRQRIGVAFLAVALSGCANTPQKPAPPSDAWILTGSWSPRSASGNATLKGRSGRSYDIPASHVANLHAVFGIVSGKSELAPRIGLIASETPNAFATTNKGKPMVFLTLPLLRSIGSDTDALATTLGHELAHLYLKHGETRKQRAEVSNGVSNVVGLALGLAGIPMGGTIANLGVGTITAAYSRDEEREADLLGLRWAMESGYSACGSTRTMRLLKATSMNSSPPFFSSHPALDERIDRANEFSLKETGHGCPAS